MMIPLTPRRIPLPAASGPIRSYSWLPCGSLSSTGFAQALSAPATKPNDPANHLFARDNLIAWCIVPFDSKKRKPEERAAMLEQPGFNLRLRLAGRAHPDVRCRVRGLEAAQHRTRRLLGAG